MPCVTIRRFPFQVRWSGGQQQTLPQFAQPAVQGSQQCGRTCTPSALRTTLAQLLQDAWGATTPERCLLQITSKLYASAVTLKAACCPLKKCKGRAYIVMWCSHNGLNPHLIKTITNINWKTSRTRFCNICCPTNRYHKCYTEFTFTGSDPKEMASAES